MALVSVGDIINEARILLQDTETGNFRWTDEEVYGALNEGLLSTKRYRPDFFRGIATPQYATTDSNVTINYPDQFKPALIDFVCGRIQQQDDEATNTSVAETFLKSFISKLTMAIA